MISVKEFIKSFEPNEVILDDLEKITSSDLRWNKLENKTIVVTGGTGFIATYLIKSLITANFLYKLNLKIICVSRSEEKFRRIYGVWSKLDCFYFFCQDFCNNLRDDFPFFDYIIHSASNASPKFYGINPTQTLLPNVFGTHQLLQNSVRNNIKKFLFFSSGSIYGIQKKNLHFIDEISYGVLDPHDLRSSYSLSKKMAENMLISWSKQYGLDVNIVRPFHTYGPGIALDDGRVFCDFVKNVIEGKDIVIKSDGLARRCFCYLSDATKGFLTVMLNGKNCEAYNIANPSQEISIKDLAQLLTTIRKDVSLEVKFENKSRGDSYLQSKLLTSLPSISKAQEIGFSPEINLKEGFAKTIKSFSKI